MKVCFVNQDMSLGGSSTVVHDLINNWPCSGDSLFLVLFFSNFDVRYKDLYELQNLKIIILNKKHTIDIPFLASLKHTMKEISPDVISSHLTCTFYLDLIGQSRKCLIFHTIHAEPSFDLPKIYRLALNKRIRSGDIKLIGVCKYISDKAEALYKTNCKTINNGFSRRGIDLRKIDEKINFLFIGRFCDVKNIDSIIKSFDYIHANKTDFTFRVCGYGDPKMENEIKRKIKNSKFSSSIEFVGKVNDTEELYKSSDVLILASKREGLPLTVLESLSFGLAFIVNPVGGIPEYVKEDFNGLYVNNCSAESIATSIQKMLSSKDKIDFFKTNSLNMAKTNDAKTMSYEYWRHFNESKQ